MNIFGIEETKSSILKKIGDISQLGGIRQYEFTDGLRKGIRAVDIRTPTGIDMTVLPDRGMDISYLSYKSVPICWRSATKETAPAFYESRNEEWHRSFFGGLLTTCGLTYSGIPCIDEGEELGLHGRISNLSAEEVCAEGEWSEDNYIISVKGKVREAKVYAEKLELTRKIKTWFDYPKILIEDCVENIGYRESPIMVLYHVNIGYPVVSSTSTLIESRAKVTPRNAEAKRVMRYSDFSDPDGSYVKQLYLHDIEEDNEGNARIAIINKDFNNKQGIGVLVKYSKNTLPFLIQWKQLGFGEYVCGINPSSDLAKGRFIERKEGRLNFIKSGEKKYFRIEIRILSSNEEIKKIEDSLS